MKLDAHIVVDAQNHTLLLRGAGYSLSACAADIQALRAQHQGPLYLLRSYANAEGKEVLVEFCEPLAHAAFEQKEAVEGARIEVWHKKLPTFDPVPSDGGLKSDYNQAAVFLVPRLTDTMAMLDMVYDLSQNIDAAWNPTRPCRSTSVGDVLVVQVRAEAEQSYGVSGDGFALIAFN